MRGYGYNPDRIRWLWPPFLVAGSRGSLEERLTEELQWTDDCTLDFSAASIVWTDGLVLSGFPSTPTWSDGCGA